MQLRGVRCLRAVCFLLAIGPGASIHAQNAVVPEYSLKAAYLYHFIQYTDWPDSVAVNLNTFNICIAADSPLQAALSAMNGKIAHTKPIAVRAYEQGHYEHCQVVVFSAHDEEMLRKDSGQLVVAHVLTVAEDPMIEADTIITLQVADSRVEFSIDRTLAHLSGLTISSKLLRLARSVK